MDVVELLEYAHEELTNGPPEMSEELAEFRWEEFGRLAERIAAARGKTPRWQDIQEVDELRDFCFNEELAHLEADRGNRLLNRLLRRIIRIAWGTRTPSWN